MAFPKYYLFDETLPGNVRVVFDDHVMHAKNFREHLEGFVVLPDPTFDVQGVWARPGVLLYANGIPNRMRDGVVWLIASDRREAFAEWIERAAWPTKETLGVGFFLPGRWLEAEEAARFWLSLQGVSPENDLETELERLGIRLERFAEHIILPSDPP